eukprot:Colp12_sorted_trinity150504_noHs@32999
MLGRPRHVVRVLLSLTVVLVVATMACHPYSPETPKRIYLQHMARSLQETAGGPIVDDSAMWINPFDYLALDPLRPFHPDFAAAQHVDATSYLHFPWILPVSVFVQRSFVLPTPPPVLAASAPHFELEMTGEEYDAQRNRRTLHFSLQGPDHMQVFVDANAGRLTGWSFTPELPPKVAEAYFVFLASGNNPGVWKFWVEFEGQDAVRLAAASQYLEYSTPEMQAYIKSMPAWASPIGWCSKFISRWY